MKNVWFFVGVLLALLGAIITVNGVYQMYSPPAYQPRLGHLHAGVWWGGVICLAGVLFLVINKDKEVD